MKKLLLISVALCTYMVLKAQPIPSAVNRFAAQRIAAKIHASLGTDRPCPQVVYGQTRHYAFFRYDTSENGKTTPKIIIDTSKIVRKLLGFGSKADDALAFIIGHEMWHYYRGPGNYFFGSWEDSLQQSIEKDADQHGLMLAYFAGYKDVISIYDQIFGVLQFPVSSHYPDTPTRQASDEFIKEKAREIVQVYDAGQVFLSNGSSPFCRMAITCYRHCGEKMLYLKEINYQIGLAYLLQGLNERGQNKYWLPLPFQQNPYQDLAAKKDDPLGMRLLDTACYYFRLAIQQDVGFSDALFGELCANVMKNTTLADSLIEFARVRNPERFNTGQLLLLKATAGLYQEESRSTALKQLTLLTLQKNDRDSITQYARANLALQKEYKDSSASFPNLKPLDNIHYLDPGIFTNDDLLLPEASYYLGVKFLKNSTLCTWRDTRNTRCVIQYYHQYPFKKNQFSALNPSLQPGRKWAYYKKETYDILVRPKENVPAEMECIKIIHNVK